MALKSWLLNVSVKIVFMIRILKKLSCLVALAAGPKRILCFPQIESEDTLLIYHSGII